MGDPVDDLQERLRDCSAVTAVVPLTGSTLAEVEDQWTAAARAGADMVEWRLDFLERDPEMASTALEHADQIFKLATKMREAAGIPVLATYRTSAEGGNLDIEADGAATYKDLVRDAAGWADVVDVEIVRPGGDDLVAELQDQVMVVASFHSFQAGVDEEFLKAILQHMERSEAAVVKVAWMVGDPDDLEIVLDAQRWATQNLAVPAVILGMGELGKQSRLGPAAKRSALTFATVGKASAPGQPTLEELRDSY